MHYASRFSKLTNENIDGNTNVAIFYSCFVNAHRPTKVRYFIFIYISPLPGNKSRHFRLTQFPAFNEKGTPVVMSEFSSPRAERSQRNRYAIATFYFSKRIASGFSEHSWRATKNVSFLLWIATTLRLTNYSSNCNAWICTYIIICIYIIIPWCKYLACRYLFQHFISFRKK